MKTIIGIILLTVCLYACSDDKEVLAPIPNDVTMNELQLGRFSHHIPDGGFMARAALTNGVNFNTRKHADGSYSGFAYSNRNNRSFTWTATPEALDSNVYSVYTAYPNMNEIYAVACVEGDDAFFTLQTPAVVEHVLVANTTYAYLAMLYGDQLGTPEAPVANPNIPGGDTKKGVWYANVPGGVKKMTTGDQDYFKLTAVGYRGQNKTGSIGFYLCTRKADPAHPQWDLLIDTWYKMELASLGIVDKVVFYLESSDTVNGRMRTPPYFCLDGIRICN